MPSRDTVVNTAPSYGLDGSGFEPRWGARSSAPVLTGPGTHPASYTVGTGYFPGLKRPGRGVDHPPQLEPKLKKEQSNTSILPLCLHGMLWSDLYLYGSKWHFSGRTE